MSYPSYRPPFLLKNGLAMTLYTNLWCRWKWENTIAIPEPPYQDTVFVGANNVPIFAWVAIHNCPKGTIIGTYGITGNLDNQWFLQLLGRKAFNRGYSVVLFDTRAHGKTAQLSTALSSNGLHEGEDFVRIAGQVKAMGSPAPFWLTGFSLGGQLALWGIQAAADPSLLEELALQSTDIAGAATLCPNLNSERTLSWMEQTFWGKMIEQSMVRKLQEEVWYIYHTHPGSLDADAIKRTQTIRDFDREFIIAPLGFSSVDAYYRTTSPLLLLPHLTKPILILYAADDPVFDPTLVSDLEAVCASNPHLELILTHYGGHVSYMSSKACQLEAGDPDRWWAWNRVLDWFDRQTRKIDSGLPESLIRTPYRQDDSAAQNVSHPTRLESG